MWRYFFVFVLLKVTNNFCDRIDGGMILLKMEVVLWTS